MGKNQRGAIVMTPEEVADFIATSRTATMATNGPNGVPHLVAMWYGVLDGKIYVMGGHGGGAPTAVVEIYDPEANAWTQAPPLLAPRMDFTSASDHGRIYVFGGSAAAGLQFDTATGNWLPLAPMMQARTSPASGILNGRLYVSQGAGSTPVATTEEYALPRTVYLAEKN